MNPSLDSFQKPLETEAILEVVKNNKLSSSHPAEPAILKKIMSLIDLTSLSTTDTDTKLAKMCRLVNDFPEKFPEIPNVAAICVYPVFVPVIKKNLSVLSVNIASVAGSFPSSQSFIEIKEQEVKMAVQAGATEIDIVLNVGAFLISHYNEVFEEIRRLKECAEKAKLKVILETGALPDYSSVRTAAFLAMEAGADFIKTSTGKLSPAATPDKFYVMLDAIRDYQKLTGKKVGIKAAGGIATAEDAMLFYSLTEEILGKSWLHNGLFRIGASRLANNLISTILLTPGSRDVPIVYF